MKCPSCGYDNIEGSDDCDNCQYDLTSLSVVVPRGHMGRLLMEVPLAKLKPRDVVCIPETTTILEAVRRMNQIKAGCVLVENSGHRIVGILTERDVLYRIKAGSTNFDKLPVTRIMTPSVEFLTEENSLAHALHQMSIKRFRHIPITRLGKGPGIISSRDLMLYLAQHLKDA